mgnify:CR=1 FL=1
MNRLKDKIFRLENRMGGGKLPDHERHHVLEGPPEEREAKQQGISQRLNREYGPRAADKALFVHIRTIPEMMET